VTRRWRIPALAVLLWWPATALAVPVDEETVQAIASGLRCVVCQNLSVGDSPSETAHQMRTIIRERLAAGDTPEQVTAYFVDKYGEWILLAPTRRGFNLLVWIVPFAGLGAGAVIVAFVVRRWSRRGARTPPPVDEAMRARIAREMADSDR
jgi:cytochrome c-type biogenesis protein CcmH